MISLVKCSLLVSFTKYCIVDYSFLSLTNILKLESRDVLLNSVTRFISHYKLWDSNKAHIVFLFISIHSKIENISLSNINLGQIKNFIVELNSNLTCRFMIIQTGLEPNQTRTEPSHNNSECLNQTKFEPNLYTHPTVLKLNLSNLQ